MIINKYMNKKKKIANFFAFFGILLFVIFTLTAATLTQEESAIAEKEATYKTALAESLNPCDGTHTNYTVVSTSGGTISSSGNYYLNGEVIGTIKIDAINVTLCLNGHDINAANADLNAVEITKDNFTLHDCGSHTRYYKIDSATKLATFDGATETDNDGSIKGGAIRGGRNNGIQSLGKTVNLLGGNVISAKLCGVAISGGNVKISDMSFIGNNGGGIYVLSDSESAKTIVNISNSYILHNSSDYGGGINISDAIPNDDKTVEVTINDSLISHNSALNTGGGLRSDGSILSISNSQINKNISKGGQGGGGIHISGIEATLTDVTVSENSANYGGGIGIDNAKIRLGGVMIIDRNTTNAITENLFIKNAVTFDKESILSAGSLVGINFLSDSYAAAIANINSLNLAYIKADDPTKMIVADNSGGLLYKNKPKITFKEDRFDNTGKNTQPFVPNEPFNLSKNPFTKDGYCFLGWSKSAFDDSISYVERQTNVIITEDKDLQLYPVWHENHDGIEFTPVFKLSDISDSGGNYVITSMLEQSDITLSSGTTNLCLKKRYFLGNINVNGTASLNIFGDDDTWCSVKGINVDSPQATLTINSGRVQEISIVQSKDIFINGGIIVKMTAMAGDFSSNSVGKIHISGSPTFGSNESQNAVIIISTAYDSFGTVTRGATLVLNNGKTGSERISYSGTPIKVALDYAKGKPAPLYGQVVAEDVSEIQQELIELVAFDSETLWDTFRSPAYPSSNRPFHLYNLSAPFDAQMNKIDFTNGKFVKFQQNNTYTTVNDLPIEDKNRIVNSLKFSSYSSEQAILNALIVSEVMYNADGTVNRILANIGLIWSLGEQGFLYTSLDGDGAFPYSGGIGTYVTFKAHNDGDSLVDTAPKDDPLSKDDFDPDGDGIGNIEIPSVPDIHPPANNEIYISYIGKVIRQFSNEFKCSFYVWF